MLISEAYDSQTVGLRALDNGRPIHVHRDVRIPNLLEWRIKISMLRAYLHLCLKFVAQTPVIDRDNVAALQFRCYVVNPLERRLIESAFSLRRLRSRHSPGKWTLDKHKLVALQIDKFFHAAADQPNRHRIQQFV